MQELLKGTSAYQLLKKEGERGEFSHAYLLVFEDGKFLRSALKTFAKVLLCCDEPQSHAENRRAELIEKESFCDCLFYPEEGKKLVVDDAERILEESALAPVEGDKKLFVLGDFAEANVQTQNKLLKLLEEPPKGVSFLLGATSTFPVLQTVISRTKKLEVQPFSIEDVLGFLTRTYGQNYDENALSVCAAASNGSVGTACKLLEGESYKTLMGTATLLVKAPLHRLPALVKQTAETGYKKELLSLLRLLYRDALLYKQFGTRAPLLLPTAKTELGEIANSHETGALLYAQECISRAEKELKFNAVFPQCLELCLANIQAKNQELKRNEV